MMGGDVWQPFRMDVVWPILVGCVAFYVVVFLAGMLDGRQLTRWQATLASVTGVCAGMVTVWISDGWDGSAMHWMAFTAGLAFAAVVLLANAALIVLQARP